MSRKDSYDKCGLMVMSKKEGGGEACLLDSPGIWWYIGFVKMRYTCDLGAQITRTFGTVAPFNRDKNNYL